jgi:uncharacterized membrane protein YeiB
MTVSDFFLHTPIWIAVAIILAGVGVLIWANRRQDRTVLRVGIAISAFGLLMGVHSLLVPSDRQKVQDRTRNICKAIEAQDWTQLGSLLDSDTTIAEQVFQKATVASGKDDVVAKTQGAVQDHGVKSITVLSCEATQTDTLITVALEVATTQDETQGRPATSSWTFDYQQIGSHWDLQTITLISVGNETGSQMVNPFR